MSTISVPAFTRKLREVVADEPKAFAYDENEPLQLIADVKPRRR